MNVQQPPIPIFIVENDNLFVKMLDYICSKDIVFKFYDYKSEEECLKNLSLKPSVVVLDHSLSGIMNSSDTIRAIKKNNWRTHIILLLESKDEKLASKLLNAGANDYVFKDADVINKIEKKLDEYLEKKDVKKPFFIPEIKPSLKTVAYFLLILLALSVGVYCYK
jgi:DNA-binding NarL/FixJ family response regulator